MEYGAAALRALAALAAAAAGTLVLARTGARVAAFAAPSPAGAWARAGLAVIAGWTVLSLCWFGLGLAGLFHPPLLAAAALLLLASGTGPRLVRLPGPWPLALVAGAPALVLAPFALLPPFYVDALDYHLGAPAQFLRLHRVFADGLGIASYFQMPAELLNAAALAVGRDALCAAVSLVPFLAGIAVAASAFRGAAGGRAAALGAGFAVSLAVLWTTVLEGKNDAAAAGFGAAGIALAACGRPRLAALVLGAACATKFNGWMVAIPAWAWIEAGRLRRLRGSWRPDPAWPLLLLAAPAAWMARTWLARGDPFWPVLSRSIGGALFDAETAAALGTLSAAPEGSLAFAMTVGRHWAVHAPALVFGLAVAALAAGRLPPAIRSAAGLAALAYLFIVLLLRPGYERYPLPVIAVAGFAAAAGLEAAARGWPAWGRRALLAVPAVLSWLPLPVALRDAGIPVRPAAATLAGISPAAEWTRARLTTLADACDTLGALPGVRSVLLIEEIRSRGWPVRTWKEEFPGRTASWALTRECATPDRIMARLRQKRASHVAFNFVTEGYPQRFAAPYSWDRRQVALWRSFVRNHLEIAAAPAHVDLANGGFYIYRVVPRVPVPPSFVFYLPGIKSLRMEIREPYVRRGDAAGAAARSLRWAHEVPDTGVFQFDAAVFTTLSRDWKEVHRLFAPGIAAGMVGEGSYTYAGTAAARSGRPAEGVALLRRAREVYTDQREDIDPRLAEALVALAAARSTPRDAALAAAAEAWSLRPSDPVVLSTLARFHLERRRWTDAKPVLEALLDQPGGTAAFRNETMTWLRVCDARIAEAR